MNAFATDGYQTALDQVATSREIEARLLSRLTANLSRAMGAPADDFTGCIRALHENERFWAAVALDLASDENQLPERLRASLLSLAGIVIKHSARVRNGSAKPELLLEINRSMIRGLCAKDDT